jgi:molecular chaperone DnaK
MKIGIDIGTYAIKAAKIASEGHPFLISDTTTKQAFTPVRFTKTESGYLIGQDAEHIKNNPLTDIGKKLIDYLDRSEAVLVDNKQKKWFPETILALFFKKIKLDIDTFNLSGVACSLAVDWSESQCKGIATATQLADMPLVGEVSAPMAAAYFHNPSARNPVLVVDWGHSGLTVSVLQKRGTQLYLLGFERQAGIGGATWTQKLADIILKKFQERFGITPASAIQAVAQVAERMKEQLSISLYAQDTILVETELLRIMVSRKEFESVLQSDIQHFASLVEKCLAKVGTARSFIEEVILVGGCINVPLVKQTIKAYWPEVKNWYENTPTSAIALGTALFADQQETKSHVFNSTDSLNYHLGVLSINSKTKRTEIDIIIHKYTALPAHARRKYYTATNSQRIMNLTIVQFEENPDDYELVGKLSIGPLNPQVNQPVEVSVSYTDDGTLSISSYNPETGLELANTFQANQANPFQFVQQRQLVRTTAVNGIS